MNLWTIAILGIATNLDNFCIGASYGMSRKRLTFLHNLTISLVSGVFSAVACAVAQRVGQVNLETSKYIGAVLLVLIGFYSVFECFLRQSGKKDEKKAHSAPGIRELLIISVILAINGAAAAFSAGLTGILALPLGASIALFSVLLMALGDLLGRKLKTLGSEKLFNILSGLLLIAIGIGQALVVH